LIVGEGEYRTSLERLIAERQLAGHVTLAGRVSNQALLDHYAIADVFVMPHRQLSSGDTEGFGVVFLEANACGVPVVAGISGGALDAVQNEVNGLTVDGENVSAIAQAIVRILEDAALRDRLCRGGLTRVLEADCRDKTGEFLDLCQCLMDSPAHSGERTPAK